MANNLLFIARLGVAGAEPLGLWDALAEQEHADHHVPEDIHKEIFNDSDRRNRAKMSVVYRELTLRAEASLLLRHSVMYDAPLNTPRRRMHISELASSLGATVVLVHPTADKGTIRNRITERYAADELYVPSSETTLQEQLAAAQSTMAALLERPDIDSEDPAIMVPHLCVDGVRSSVPEILQAERAYVDYLTHPS
jgi:predicted kinase